APGRTLLKTNMDVQDAIKAGLKSIINVPVRSGGAILGVLSLQSTEVNKFNIETKKILDRLDVDQALLAIFHERERAEERFVSDFLKKIWASGSHTELAKAIVDGIGGHYDFRTVSIFGINAIRHRFNLLAEARRGSGRRADTPDDQQSLDTGLKGLAYKRGER